MGSLLAAEQIVLHQILQQFVAVNLADHAAGIVVIGDIGGVFGEKITYDLVDGVVTFLTQGVEYTPEDAVHILFVVAGYCELNGVFRHGNRPPSIGLNGDIIADFLKGVKP